MRQFYRKTFLLVIFLLRVFNTCGQKSFDTSMIDRLMLNSYNQADTSPVDFRIINVIKSFDKHYLEILAYDSCYARGKYSILYNGSIKLRKLLNKGETLATVICGATHSLPIAGPFDSNFNYKAFWNLFSNDTTRFLSNLLVKDDFELYYPNHEIPKEYSSLQPASIAHDLQLENIIFNTGNLNQKIKSVANRLKRKERFALWKYIERRYNDFYTSGKRLVPCPIMITDITFGNDNIIYVGADIYGAHYLLTFNESLDYKFESRKELWVY